MNDDQFSVLQGELRRFLRCGLYESVEILASLFLSAAFPSSAGNHDQHQQNIADAYEIIGDALHGKRETKRALQYYRLANEQLSLLRKHHLSHHRGRDDTHSNGLNTSVELLLRECECLYELHDYPTVISTLQNSSSTRDIRVSLLKAKCYLASNLKTQAIEELKVALSFAPLGLELVIQLSKLGIDDTTILQIVRPALANNALSSLVQANNWYFQLIAAIHQMHSCQVLKSLSTILTLLTTFPQNVFILRMAVDIHAQSSDANEIPLFQQLRRLDATVVDDMDSLGLLLWRRKDAEELSRLASEVIACQPTRPEGYNIAALYSALKDEHQHAVAFTDKVSIALDFSLWASSILPFPLI
jgi:tetratricopeptide (TPR) repeat protein